MIEIEKWNGYVTENPLLKYLAFVKTVETGSFTRAAQALSYAQSSSSKMVADLEQEWGMTLLERSKSVVCLTSAGAQVLPFLRRLLQEQQALEGQISRMNGVETGVVRIGTFSSVAINWLPNIFSALQTDYPGISYDKKEIRFMGMIVTSKAPGAIGPYSQGYAANGFVFVSGQLPINPETARSLKLSGQNCEDDHFCHRPFRVFCRKRGVRRVFQREPASPRLRAGRCASEGCQCRN